MKIEVATGNSVFVELSPEDLLKWGLSFERFGEEKEKTKRMLQEILFKIHTETGVLLSAGEAEIDVLPSRGGGCLMVVANTKSACKKSGPVVLCVFQNADAFLDCLHALGAERLWKNAEMYRAGERFLLLLLCDTSETQRRFLREYARLHDLTAFQTESIRERLSGSKILCSTGSKL